MNKSVRGKLNKGISPKQFVDGMQKNKEAFVSWYDQFAWADESDRDFFESLNSRKDLRCLILMADWCGDVVRNIPVVFRVTEAACILTEVLIVEEHQDLMDQYLTMGGRAIPIVIFADASGQVLAQWGPRPKDVQAIMTKFKQENPDREAPDYQEKIQVARQQMAEKYGEGTGYHAVIVKELRKLLSTRE